MFAVFFLAGCILALMDQGTSYRTPLLVSVKAYPKYFVYKSQKTWTEARQFCEHNGLELAIILTYQEQQNLRKYIRENDQLPRNETSGYWLGAQAKAREWFWEKIGEPIKGDNFLAGWHWGEPNYRIRNDGEIQQCMELKYINNTEFDRSLSWNDMWCDEKRGFICQIPENTNEVTVEIK